MIKVTKRENLPMKKAVLIRVVAILLSLVFAGLVMMVFRLNPIQIYMEMINGSIGTEMRIKQTIMKAIPLIIASLGIMVAFRMKFWNIGGEGQIMMGAMASTYLALNFSHLPSIVLLPLMAVASMVAGGIWAFIPAFFKAKMGTNETIFTLMMNYIAIKFVTYLQYGPWKDPEGQGFPRIATFQENAILPQVFGVHVGWIIALLLVVIIYIFINYTKKGFEINVVGESLETARYAGMSIKGIIITSMLISGGLCGLTGMIQASAVEKSLSFGISAGYGFTAIITAWLSRLNAIAILFVCIIFAMMIQGGAYLQIAMQVPASVADIVQGTILFFILGSDFFITYKIKLNTIFQKVESKEVA